MYIKNANRGNRKEDRIRKFRKGHIEKKRANKKWDKQINQQRKYKESILNGG